MDYTTNKILAKPTENETYDLATVNENMDKIDAALKTNDDAIKSLTDNLGRKPKYSTYFIHNAWNTIYLNSNGNVLLLGHLIGDGNAIDAFFCYLIAAGGTESNTGKYYKIAGTYEPTLNWNNGISIGIYASDSIWMEYSVLWL